MLTKHHLIHQSKMLRSQRSLASRGFSSINQIVRGLVPIVETCTMDATFYEVAQSNNCEGFPEGFYTQRTANGNSILHVLAESSDSSANAVKQILALNPYLISSINNKGETPLIVAARAGHSEVVRALIDAGAKDLFSLGKMLLIADDDGNTALHEAVRFNLSNVVELLVKHHPVLWYSYNFADESPLYLAVEKGYHQIAKSILSSQPMSCHLIAISYYQIAKLILSRLLISHRQFPTAIWSSIGLNPWRGPQGRTVLHAAALRNCPDCMKLILENIPTTTITADDDYGWTALHYAAKFNHTDMVTQMLSANKLLGYAAPRRSGSRTALHIAVIHGHVDVIRQILGRCPDCWEMITHKAQNMLHLAVFHEQKEVLDFIFNMSWASQLINKKDVEGNTPLHLYAATKGLDGNNLVNHPKVDRNAFNNKDMTPLDTITLPADQLNERQISIKKQLTEAGAARGLRNVTTNLNKTSKTQLDKTSRAGQEKPDTDMVVAALIVTVTFAAAFTVPGGFDATEGNKGMAVLAKKAAFMVFVVSDLVAFMFSVIAMVTQFGTAAKFLPDKKIFRASNAGLISVALIALVTAFLTGLYAVLPIKGIRVFFITTGALMGYYYFFPVFGRAVIMICRTTICSKKIRGTEEVSYSIV